METDRAESATAQGLRIVGVGASAGGLESLRVLFDALPDHLGVAYVVLQHLAPTHRSLLTEILAKRCALPVREVSDGDLPEPNLVLVTPPNSHIEFDGQRLRLTVPDPQSLPRPSINLFFSSLANHLGERAAGMILSGTGADGALGLRQIHQAGGLALIQPPDNARYAGMPEAALRAVGDGSALVLPQDVGAALRRWLGIDPTPAALAPRPVALALNDPDEPLTPLPVVSSDELDELVRRVRQHCGINLADYKEGTLLRRLARRCLACEVNSVARYLRLVEEHPEELRVLAAEMLISVTTFWRDPEAFELLREHMGRLVAGKNSGDMLRVWVAGCATGEEAYSVAMICCEAMQQHRDTLGLQIFATDLDLEAIKLARRGLYGESAIQQLPDALRERFLIATGEQFEVADELRAAVVFSRHDLTRDPPFPRLDLVVCRNVLIYLKPQAQARVMRAFHFSLLPGGLLFLGQSESTLGHDRLFRAVSKEVRLHERLDGSGAWIPTLRTDGPGIALPSTPLPPVLARNPAGPELTLLRRAAQTYLPPCLLLDDRLQVLHMHGDLTPFLALRPGPQALDVLSLARSEIATPLRLLCTLLGSDRNDPLHSEVSLRIGRREQRWRLQINPFNGPQGQRWAVLAFIAQPPRRRRTGAPSLPSHEEELTNTREHMKVLVEQLEAFNEEMQALNEEAQATNEELQASNEELESTNEELQATNQELSTVNAELNYQWRAHRQLAEELQSIQNSIDMPQLVIDAQLTIRRYNSAAAQLFQLSVGCEGLHLSTLARPPGMVELTMYVARAEHSASPLRISLPPTDAGNEYVLHLSHNILDGERRGTVLTLVDNTELAQAERHTRQAEGRLLSVLTHGRAMVAIKDTSGRYEFANAQYAAFFGVDSAALIGRTDAQAMPAAVAGALRQRDLEFLQLNQPLELEERFVWDQRERSWWATRFGLEDDQGIVDSVCIQALDLSAGQDDDNAWRIATKIFDVSTEGIFIVDAAGQIQRVNAAFTTLTGYSSEDARGSSLQRLDSGRHGFAFFAGLLDKVREQGRWQGEAWHRRKDGKVFPGWLSLSALHDVNGRLSHFVGLLTDISALNDTRESMRRLATEDPLTGLPNRSLLLDRLAHAVETASRHRTELALCFVDLDNFKTVNDSLGHDAGDEVLRLAARRIGSHVRSADTLARIGGDEFVLLLENTNRHDCLQTVERITRTMGENVTLAGNVISTSCSIGIALFPGDGADAQVLLSHADAAMYRAKRSGRSRYEFFSPEVGDSARNRLKLESGLRLALERQELCLHYQPQVDVDSGGRHLQGVEALLRWSNGNGESISPAIFLPIAEESSLIDSIGEWVIDAACTQLAAWRRAGLSVPRLSVNISPRQLRDRHFAERLQEVLAMHGIPGELLVLEITESALLQGSDELTSLLRRIDQMGVQFSLDDFGTGYSSLAALRALPLDELKIDRSFVHGVLDQRDDREIVDAIVGLGRALGLRLVAEGVETEAQIAHFRRYAPGDPTDLSLQGFQIARPMPAGDFTSWLQRLETDARTAAPARDPAKSVFAPTQPQHG